MRGLVIAPGSSEGESEFGGDGRPGGDRRETDDMLRPDASSRTDNSRHLSPSPSRYRQGSVNFPSCRGSGRRPSLINDPNLRLRPGRDEDQLAQAYHTIVESRGTLKRLNDEVATAQSQALEVCSVSLWSRSQGSMLLLTFSLGLQDVTTGRNLHGFILTGSNVRFLDQAVPIDGAAQGDIVWLELQKSKGKHSRWGVVRFWLGTALVGVVLAGACESLPPHHFLNVRKTLTRVVFLCRSSIPGPYCRFCARCQSVYRRFPRPLHFNRPRSSTRYALHTFHSSTISSDDFLFICQFSVLCPPSSYRSLSLSPSASSSSWLDTPESSRTLAAVSWCFKQSGLWCW